MAENDWKSRLGVVFSTNPDFKYQTEEQQVQQETLPPQKQRLRVFLEKKNRGGKQVTVVEGFAGSEDNAATNGNSGTALCKRLNELSDCHAVKHIDQNSRERNCNGV